MARLHTRVGGAAIVLVLTGTGIACALVGYDFDGYQRGSGGAGGDGNGNTATSGTGAAGSSSVTASSGAGAAGGVGGMGGTGGSGGPVADCTSEPDTTPCHDPMNVPGKCWAGACCTGCWNGTSCAGGVSTGECGKGGEMCNSCVGCQTFCNAPMNTACNPQWGFTPCGCIGGTCTLGTEECCANGCNASGCL